jgi:voltage-gated potassium channel
LPTAKKLYYATINFARFKVNSQTRLRQGLIVLASILAAGTIGYMKLEGWSFGESIFMTVITVSTVGYGEVHPLSAAGRAFTIFLIGGGVSGVTLVFSALIEYIIEGRFRSTLGRRQMKAKIAKLQDHFILCGFGRVGEDIARTFSEEGFSFIIVDNRPDIIKKAEKAGHLYLLGDATSDETLVEAGIERARGLVAAVDSDVDNTYITLSARGMRSDMFIEARASNEEAEIKLKRAGASRVVSPNKIGARRMAMLATRPAVADFIDTVTYGRGREMDMENIVVGDNCPLATQTVDDIRRQSRVIILAISKKTGRLLANPTGDTAIEVGDLLIVIGTKKQLAAFEGLCEGGKSSE